MFKFVLTYPEKLEHDQMRSILSKLRYYPFEWLKEQNVLLANISTSYNEVELPDKTQYECILEFDLEPECYGGPDPVYHQKCKNIIAKFGQDIVVDRKYCDILEVDGQLPDSYYIEEI